MAEKHTPGPWEARPVPRMNLIAVAEGGKHYPHAYATTSTDVPGELTATAYADARLIAAAPELLELVREAFRDPDSEILGTAWNHYAAEVLARIDGEG